MLLTAESVTAALTSLTEGSILQHVIREDVKGFREAVHASRALVVCLERAAPLLRAVHARYAMRGDEHSDFPLMDDQGGYGLSLARFTEMVWDAKLIGRELSRNNAKTAFVNALNVGDALAGISEFGEVVVRLAHAITPLTREERVGAPPPPTKAQLKKKDKWGGSGSAGGAAPALPPPLLVPGGAGVIFEAGAEATLLAKLETVCQKLVPVATDDPDDPILPQLRALYPPDRPRVRGQPLGNPVPFPTSLPGPPPPPMMPPPDAPLSASPLQPSAHAGFPPAHEEWSPPAGGFAADQQADGIAIAMGGGFGHAASAHAASLLPSSPSMYEEGNGGGLHPSAYDA